MTSASDPAGTYSFTVDGLGRTTSTVASSLGLSSTVTLDAAYDSRGNRTQAAFKIGATSDFKNTYAYDPLSRLTQLAQQGNGGNTVKDKRVDFSYDAAGQFQKLSRFSDTAGTQLVASSGYAFDRLGRLVNLSHQKVTSEIAGYRMAYDAAGRLVRIDPSVDEVSQFNYDKQGQLTSAKNTFEADESYAYDANGNRTSGGSNVQANNRLASDATYSYTYDDEGNRLSRVHKVSGDRETYTWDQRNRLIEVKFSNSATMVSKMVRYSYDVFDRLVKREADTTHAPAPEPPGTFNYDDARTEVFVYDGDDVALDFLDLDGGQSTYSPTLQKRYLHGPAVDQVLAQEDVTLADVALNVTHPDRVLWHLTDNLGSVRDLVRADGSTMAHLQYDAFGNLIDGLESVTRYQFTGREHDPDTDLQYNRARWYDPKSAQWMSEDPIGFSAGDANLKRYVGNGPTNWRDPNGLQEMDINSVDPNFGLSFPPGFINDNSIFNDNFYVDGNIYSPPGSIFDGRLPPELTHNWDAALGRDPNITYLEPPPDPPSGAMLAQGVAAIKAGQLFGIFCRWLVARTSPATSASPAAPTSPLPTNPIIQVDKQGKHIPGHKGFQPGKGEWTHPSPQDILNQWHGKGVRHGSEKSGWREAVDCGELVGKWADEATGTLHPTTRFTIHYSRNGQAHLVPAKPIEYLPK
jgi:RHS repeat-associated protein